MLRVVSSVSVVSVLASFVAGCGGAPDPGGQIVVCYAVDDDGVPGPGEADDGYNEFARTELQTRRGLHNAAADASWPAPAHFTSCISTIVAPVQVELIDEDGHHVWLAVDVVASGTPLMNERVFADIVDGELTIAGNRAWGISDIVTLRSSDEDAVRLALQNGLPLDATSVPVFIDDDGADGLPTWTSCQSITAHRLLFLGQPIEGTPTVLKNGEVGRVEMQSTEYVVTNVGSFEYGEANCTDIPSGVTHVSWAVIADR